MIMVTMLTNADAIFAECTCMCTNTACVVGLSKVRI